MAFFVPWLVDAARMAVAGTGKTVIVSPGWQTRGHGGMRVVEGVVGHHTATPETAPGDYPTLTVVRDGRAGLAGPLAQLGLGRSGNVYVIAAGLSYHAGASAHAGFVDLNDEYLGIEAEDSGDGRWTPDQLRMYPRLVGALLAYLRRGVDRYASHRTVAVPAGRKLDPAGITDQWMRERAAAFLAGGGQEDDMATPQEIAQAVWAHPITFQADPQNPGGPADVHLAWANWCSQESQKILLQQRATLAAILAAQEDDVTDTDVLERLEQAMGVEVDRLRAELAAARAADRAAMVEAVRDTVPAELADQVVTRLGERLTTVT